MTKTGQFLAPLRSIHARIRDAVVDACQRASEGELSRVVADGEGDTIYAVDRVSEELLVELFEREIATIAPIVLIAEGLPGGQIVLPRGTRPESAEWRIIADPVDGTRCLMYQKRSGWILTGIAPNLGEATTLADIELAVQTEIPLVKQHLSDAIWAVRGAGAGAERLNRITGERRPLVLQPSKALDLSHGFASVTRFFSGGRDILASIDDEITLAAVGLRGRGKAHCFEDQYLSTGGQLYELMSGHDRFQADLRPLLAETLESRGLTLGLCCHPYDLCTELIARELGVLVTDECGRPLGAPLNVEAEVAWAGYSNQRIRDSVEPLLVAALRHRGLLAT
jgi:hypothetical protein